MRYKKTVAYNPWDYAGKNETPQTSRASPNQVAINAKQSLTPNQSNHSEHLSAGTTSYQRTGKSTHHLIVGLSGVDGIHHLLPIRVSLQTDFQLSIEDKKWQRVLRPIEW